MGGLQDAIILYLASKNNRCATAEELIRAAEKHSKGSNPRHQVFKALSRLARKGMLKRGWVEAGGKKARIYCLKT